METIFIGTPLLIIHRLAHFKSREQFLYMLKNERGIATTQSTITQWANNDKIPVLTLIALCNIVYFPSAYYFGIKGFKRKVSKYLTVKKEDWQPIFWDTKQFIKDCMAKFHHRKKEVREKLQMSQEMFTYLENGDMDKLAFMSIGKFLSYVNKAGFAIVNYIIDLNVPYDDEDDEFADSFSDYLSILKNGEPKMAAADTNALYLLSKDALIKMVYTLEQQLAKAEEEHAKDLSEKAALRQENLQLQKALQDKADNNAQSV